MSDNNVYHYCSVDTFLKIIKNRELWLTDVTKSNDSKELQIAEDTLNDVLNKRIANCDQNGSDIKLLNEFKEELKTLEIFEKLFHVCCFSTKRDSLSQWAMYADDAKGVAIGINKDSLNDLAVHNKNMDFRKICYKLDGINDTINHKLNRMLTKYNATKEINDNLRVDFVEFALNEVVKKAYFYKNESFIEESEYRLVYNSKPYSSHQEDDGSTVYEQILSRKEVNLTSEKDMLGKMDFYVSNGKLISYRPLRPYSLDSLINEIVIGPKSAVKCDDVEMLLKVNGINNPKIKVYKSKITYQ